MSENDPVLRVPEIAKRIGETERTTRNLLKRKLIKGTKKGTRHWKALTSEVDRYLRGETGEGGK